MHILPSVYKETVHLFKQSFLPQLTAQQKFISALALIALSFLAACYAVYHYCFKANAFVEQPQDIPKIEESAKMEYQKGIGTFSFDVLQKVMTESPNDNKLVSPLGISLLLSMLKHGVGSKEQEEIERIIHLPQNEDAMKVSAFELIKKLQKKGFDLAGLVYLNPDYRLNSDYQKLVSPYYQSKVQEGNSASDINQWVKKITNGQIPDILKQEDLKDFILVLANAIHFQADFAHPFDIKDTYLSDFAAPTKKVKVNMMHKKDIVGYFENDKCQAIQLNYKDKEGVSLMLILPKEDNDFSSINLKAFDEMAKRFINTEVKISLPKFKLEEEIDVKAMLKEMGMKDLLENPDFSKLIDYRHLTPEDPEISKIKQKSTLVCDEKGIEASTVTVALATKGLSKEINFNRPFLAALVTKEAPIMFGVVRDPSV